MPKLLFVGVGGPDGDPMAARLLAGNEARAIQNEISHYPGETFDFESVFDIPREDLVDEIAKHAPTVLHFAGHGTEAGAMVVQDGTVTTRLLADIARSVEPIELVYFNSCFGAKDARPLLKHVQAVIGMKSAIYDDHAVDIAVTFYREIAKGKCIAKAFERADAKAKSLSANGSSPLQLFPRNSKAERLVLRGVTELCASFETRRGAPVVRKNKYYGMVICVANAPDGATDVVYELHEDYDQPDALRNHNGEGRFRRVSQDRRGFQTWIQTEDDFEIRAVVWTAERGIAIRAMVTEALVVCRNHAQLGTGSRVSDVQFQRAVRFLKNNPACGTINQFGAGNRPRGSASRKAKKT